MRELPGSWARVRLDEVAEVKLGRQRSPKNHVGVRMRPYLRAANVTWSGLNLSDVKEMNFTEEESEVFELLAGDVLVAEASGSASEVGKTALWRGEITNCCFQNTLLRVRSYGPLPEYLLYLLGADALTGRLGDAARGVGIHHLGAARLASWVVPIAPLSEQRRIVAAIEEYCSRLDAACDSLRRARSSLNRLREAALGQLLSGDWPVVTLAELAELTTKGTTPTSIGYGFADEGVLFVKAESIVGGVVDHNRCAHIDDRTDEVLARSRLAEDDILVTIAGTLGRVGRVRAVDLPANTNQAVSLTRLKDRALAPWVLTWLQGPAAQRYLKNAGRGVGLQNLNLKQIADTPVRLPPVDEQRRIVAEVERQLSIVDAMAAEVETAFRRSASLRRSILEQAFSGKLVPQDHFDEPAALLVERIASERAVAPKPPRRRRGVPA